MTEFGLFNDEGCIEDGLWSHDEATAAIAERYPEEDGLVVAEICPDHPEQQRHHCEECNAEEEE